MDRRSTIRMPYIPEGMDYTAALSGGSRADFYDCKQSSCTRSHQTDTLIDRPRLLSRAARAPDQASRAC
jgi:hypothetical protein